MRKIRACLLVFVLNFAVNFPIIAGAQDSGTITRNDIELVKQLTRCVDHNLVVVRRVCLTDNFFPRLDLGPRDKVLSAEFGMNTDGRWFSMTIRKVSRSGGTIGLFDVTFYTERHRRNSGGFNEIFFDVRNGHTYSEFPNDSTGVVNIYDLSFGHHLINNSNGETVGTFDLPESQHWSLDHTAGNLINAGKTVGYILEERLETLEKSGKGGQAYTDSTTSRYSSFRDDSKYRLRFFFK